MSDNSRAWRGRDDRYEVHDRDFEVWSWSVHHKQLLIRSPGNRGQPNLDVLFTAVDHLSLPVRFTGLRLEATMDGVGRPGKVVFAVRDGRGQLVGSVVAAAWTSASNDDEPGGASPLSTPEDGSAFARHYEQSLLLALPELGRVEAVGPRDRGVDAWLTLPSGFRIAIEAKAVPSLRGGQRLRLLASAAAAGARAARTTAGEFDGFLLVLGTWSRVLPSDENRFQNLDRALIDEIGTRLRQHLDFRSTVVIWQPGEATDSLRQGVARLIS